MNGYYKKGIKRLGLMALVGALLGLKQLKKAGKKMATRISPAIKKSVAKADRFVDEKSRQAARKTREEFAEKTEVVDKNQKQGQTEKTKVTAEEFFGRKKTERNSKFQIPDVKSSPTDSRPNARAMAGGNSQSPIPNVKSNPNDSMSNSGTANEIAAVAPLPRNDNLANKARNFKFSILKLKKPLYAFFAALCLRLEPYIFAILVFILRRLRQIWRWFGGTEWGKWAIEKLSPWFKFFRLLAGFLGRKLVSLNTAQKVAATMVIFALIWQGGLSVFAQESNPIDQIVTPEMKVLKDVNPELLKAENFEKEKQIEEIKKEKEGEINYTLGGLVPKTDGDKVTKEETKILEGVKENLQGGLLTSKKTIENTVISFSQSRNPRVKQAALNVRDLLKAKGLFRSIYDEKTGEEKEISTQIDSSGDKLKPTSVPFGAEFGNNFRDGMIISDLGEDQAASGNSQLPISNAKSNSNDSMSNDGTASGTSGASGTSEVTASATKQGSVSNETLGKTASGGMGGFNPGGTTASGNFQLPISNVKSNSNDLMSNTNGTTASATANGIAAVTPLPRNDNSAGSQGATLTGGVGENISKGLNFASKIYKVLTEGGDKLLVDKTPQFKENISFKPKNANPAHAVYADNKILYRDAWTGVDVLHSVKTEGVKEDIIIKDKTAPNKLYFEIKTKGLRMRIKDGGLQFYDIFGGLKFETPRPFMVDRFGNSKDLNYKLAQDKDLVKQVSITEPAENAADATKTGPAAGGQGSALNGTTASGNFQLPIPNAKSNPNDSMPNGGTASGTSKPTSFLQNAVNGAKSLAWGIKNTFLQIPRLLAETFWTNKALADENGASQMASGNFQLPISLPTGRQATSNSNSNSNDLMSNGASPTYDKFFTNRSLTLQQKKINAIVKNSSPKNGQENKLGFFDDVVHQAAEALNQSPGWVLSIFSDEQIKLIAGTLEQVQKSVEATKVGPSSVDQGSALTATDYSDEMLKDINEERTYTVVIEIDFTGMNFPIDLDPTTYVNLQDQGQATFFGDYAGGSTSGTKGFMNGYGGMTRSSEPFLPQGSFRGYWPMDGDGVITNDYSGSANTLTNNGTMTTTAGKFSGAGSFDGSTKYLSLADNVSLSITGALTFGAWFKTNSASTDQFILSKNGSYRLEIEATGKILASLNGTAATRETSSAIDTNWHHIMAVYNPTGTTLDVYLDGVLNNGTLAGVVPGNITDSAGAFNIGADATANKFNGLIDEAVVWARNLSAAEITQIYGGGRVENTDSSIVYVDPDGTRIQGKVGTDATALQANSPWTYSANASSSNGSHVAFITANLGDVGTPNREKAYVEYTFTGTEIWLGTIKNNVPRFIKATVDEGTVNEVVNYLDVYNPSSTGLFQQKMLIATGLANSSHTVRMYPQMGKDIASSPAATNYPPNFDFFEYYTSGNELAKKSAITINSRATSGLDFINTKPSPAVSYDARGNVPANASGNQERGTWSSWVKTDFAWNTDNAPHYVWSNENARLYYLYDGSTNGNWYYEMYNGTDWTTVQVKSANYTSGNTFASGQVFHLAVSWDATVGTNLYVNNVKTSYVGTWTAQAMTGNMKVGGDEKTKLLLHGDGANNSTSDIDGSGNGYPVTLAGNAKVSTTQNKFGGSSFSLDGVNGSYVTVPDSNDWAFGTGDFTIEMWVNFNALPTSGNYIFLYNQCDGASPQLQYSLYNNSGTYQIRVAIVNGSTFDSFINISPTLVTGSWYHFALVRSGTSFKQFINGVQQGSDAVSSLAVPDVSPSPVIGASYAFNGVLNGYMDEVRITKGLARWTGNFTPPTGPYQSNLIIAEPTILNYVLTDAEINAVYKSAVSMGDMINGTPGSAAVDTQKKLFSAAKRSEEINQTSKSLLFNFSGVQTADARVGAGAGSLYKTAAPTNPSTTVAETALTWSGAWTDAGNYRSTTDANASAIYTTSAAATEIWATYYANTDKGIAEYIIDEGTAKEVRTKVDQYASAAADRYALLATGLESATHTIRVRMLNSRNSSSTANGIIVGLSGTADRMFYFGTTPDIATQDMVVNGKQIKNVLVEDFATMPNMIQYSGKGNISQNAFEGTMSTWVQTSWAGNDNTFHAIFSSRDASANNGVALWKCDGGTSCTSGQPANSMQLIIDNASSYITIYSSSLTASSWAPNVPHHLVAKWWRPTSTTMGMTVYLDGIKIVENKSQTFTPNTQSYIMLGNWSNSVGESYDLDGAIYDLSLWSWAFDDGNTTLNSYAQPQSDVWKSWKGEAPGVDEDLSSQIDGATSTLKLARGGIQQTYSPDTYTKLLLHANGANAATTSFDSSLTGKPITQTNATISTAQSEFGGSSYNFNGTSAFLEIPDSNDWNYGSSDFTMEAWAKVTAYPATAGWLFGQYDPLLSGANNSAGVYINSSGFPVGAFATASGASTITGTTNVVAGGAWYHIALVRNGSYIRLYVNGTEQGTAVNVGTNSIVDSPNVFRIGRDSSAGYNQYLTGYLDEIRISKGTARWTSAFTPPTSEYSAYTQNTLANSISVKSEGAAATVSSVKAGGMAKLENASGGTLVSSATSITIDPGATDANTKLLLHADGANGQKSSSDDSSAQHILTHGGTAQTSTAQYKFGGTGYYFDGSSGYINSPGANTDWNFGTNDFTIDFWMDVHVGTNYSGVMSTLVDTGNVGWAIQILNGKPRFYSSNGPVDFSGASLSADTWYHFALVRHGTGANNLTWYVNGVGTSTSIGSNVVNGNNVFNIGKLYNSTNDNFFNGYLDEIRVSSGVARWTADFSGSLPTGPYANTSYDMGSNIDTTGGYLTLGQAGSNRKQEMVQYSSYNTSTNTFTVSQRGLNGTTATDWPNDTPIEVGGTVTLSSAPASGAKVLTNYTYQGDELAYDRGQTKSRLGQNNFLDYTTSAATGWALSGDTVNKSGRQQMTTQVAGQNSFGYFYGAELGYIFSGDTTNGGVAMVVVDEGTGSERRVRSDQNNSNANQFNDQLFSGLSPGYHTFRIIFGVDKTNAGANKYGTFDSFVFGTKSDLSLSTGDLAGSETTNGNLVNDTFYYPAWKDQDDVKNTRDSNTKLLLHADGANNATASYDSALPQHPLTHSGAIISTAQSKFGGSAYYFNGATPSFISTPDSSDWYFGSDNFTIDTWVYLTNVSNQQSLISISTGSAYWELDYHNTQGLTFQQYNGASFTVQFYQNSVVGWSNNTWYHVAVVRNGNNWNLYKDGVSVASTTSSTAILSFAGTNMQIGALYWPPAGGNTARPLTGYMDEIRITKGIARWAGNFTVPDKSYGGFALTADINTSVTSLVLDSENPSDLNKLGPNGVVKIGSEYIRYESKAVNGNQATLSNLTRGYAQSTAATHSNNDATYPCGGWRNNYYAQQSSWYKENGAFPEKALITGLGAEGQVQGGLSVINLADNSAWAKYEAGASNTIKAAVKTVSAAGGKILAGYGTGGNGLTEIDLVNDSYNSHGSGNDSYTKLLLHGDGSGSSFTDSEPTPKAVTAYGNATQTTSQSKMGGSSAYFDGVGDYISAPDSADWNFGSGDFTVDLWVNPSSLSSNNSGILCYVPNSVAGGWGIRWGGADTNLYLWTSAAGNIMPVAFSNFVAGQWSHVALVRSSGIATFYINGVAKNSASVPTLTAGGVNLVAGRLISDFDGYYFTGYLDEIRVTKGLARWTSNFVPPAAPYGSLEKTGDIESYYDGTNYNIWAGKSKDGTAGSIAGVTYLKDTTGNGILNSSNKLDGEYENDYYTKLMLHADGTGATFVDSADPAKTVTAYGAATQSATQSEFGGKSAYFDGTGSYIQAADSIDFEFGVGNFTVDFWAYGLAGANGAVVQFADGAYGGSVGYVSGGNLVVYLASAGGSWGIASAVSMGAVPGNSWVHYALVRNGNNFYTYRNGTQISTFSSSAAVYNPSGNLNVGRYLDTTGATPYYLSGYVDELRITKGIARWAGAFTPPTRAYENFAAKKIKYDSTNDVLYADQSSGTANLDVWSKIPSPKISADSTIDIADGTTRMSSQVVTQEMAQDATNIYFATDSGVKKVVKSSFSSVALTFDSSNLTNLVVNTARTVDYDSVRNQLVMGFSGTSGHNGRMVLCGTTGSSPAYFDYFGETSANSSNNLVSDVFYSSAWVPAIASGYTGFAVGTDQGVSLVRFLDSETLGTGGGVPKSPMANSDNGFLGF